MRTILWSLVALLWLFPVLGFNLNANGLKRGRWGQATWLASKDMSPSPPVAPRVQRTPGSTSVSQQIAWVRARKRLLASSLSSTGRKFRQERGPKTTVEDEELLSDVDYSRIQPPAVFVDGYNVIGFTNVWEQRSGVSLDEARDRLLSDLAVLRGGTGWHIELVFDAYKHSAPEKSELVDGVVVTYTSPSETADDCIERRFNALAQAGFTNMVVATDDNLLRMTAQQLGAGFLTCSMLLEEIRIAYSGWEAEEESMAKASKAARPTIGDGISSELKDAISLLRANQQLKNAVQVPPSSSPTSSSFLGGNKPAPRAKESYVKVTSEMLSQLKATYDDKTTQTPPLEEEDEGKKKTKKKKPNEFGLSDSDIDNLIRKTQQKAKPNKPKTKPKPKENS